jgi:hypothetical protein
VSVDLAFAEAVDALKGFEVLGIQKHYGEQMEHLGGVKLLLGTVWAFRNRDEKTDWSTVERMTIKEAHAFFAEPDPDPESDQGKDESADAQKPGS